MAAAAPGARPGAPGSTAAWGAEAPRCASPVATRGDLLARRPVYCSRRLSMLTRVPRIAPSEITPPEVYFSRRTLLAGALASVASASLPAVEGAPPAQSRSEEHTSELQSQSNLVCRLLL